MGNAGRVLMIPKGDYNAATTYEMLDFVYYQGRSYVCKQTSTGNVPTNTTYWQALTGDASAEIQALTNQLTSDTPTTVDYASIISLTDALGVNAKDVKLKVEPVQDLHGYSKPWVGGAGKNKLDIDEDTSTAFSNNNGVLTSTIADTRAFQFRVIGFKNDSSVKDLVSATSITTTGIHEFTFTIEESDDINQIRFGHNGSSTNIMALCPFTLKGTWKISFNAISINSTVVGGLVLSNIMVSANGGDYEPYTNICPIAGWTGANVTVADAETDPTTTETYVISFGDTYYLAELDVTSGVLTVLGVFTEPTEFTAKSGTTSNNLYQTDAYANIGTTVALMSQAICNRFEYVDYGTLYANNVKAFGITSDGKIGIGLGLDGPATLEDANTWLSNNPLQIVYMLATSQTIQLTPTQIQLLQGNNAISADCGDVSIQYFKELNIGGAVAELQTAVNAILAQLS